MDMQDKVVIVTGSASGMGVAEVKLFANDGAKVVVADVNKAGAFAVAQEINAAGGIAMGCGVDLTNADDLRHMVDEVMEKFGRIDVLVNNAGVFDKYTTLLDTTDEQWDFIYNINVKSVFRLCRLVLPQMIERGSGAIVNIASIAGLVAKKGGAAYTSSKHAVIGLTKHLSSEYAKDGIKINAVCPGTIVTPLIKDVADSIPKDNVPMRRFGTPEEVAQLVEFLASDEADFMNGSIIPIDGGYTIQ
mgnify:CR=1 FL=1